MNVIAISQCHFVVRRFGRSTFAEQNWQKSLPI